MPLLEARRDNAYELIAQGPNGGKNGGQQQAKECERAFLNALVELIHADLPAGGLPESVGFCGIDAMDEDRPDQFAVQFAAQAVLFASIGLVDPQNGFELLEQQLDLPAHRVQHPNHFQRKPL